MAKEAHDKVTVAYSLTQAERRIFSVCSKCQEVLAEGIWALDGELSGAHYLIGPSPRLTCCGKEQYVPFLFETAGAAQDKMNEVCKEIRAYKSHLIYNYYGVQNFISKYVH